MDRRPTTNTTRPQLDNSCRITEALLRKILLGQSARARPCANAAGREEETDSEAVTSDAVVAAQPAEHGKEQGRHTLTENGREEGEAEERHVTAMYQDFEHQEGAVQELASASTLQRTARRTTRLQLRTVEHIELASDT